MNMFLKSFLFILFSFQFAFAQVNTEKYRKSYDEKGFFGNVSLAAGLNKGNSDFITAKGELRLDYVLTASNYFLVSNYEFKEASDKKIVNKGFAHLRGMFRLSDHFSAETFVQKEFNDFILLNDRNLAGAGLRYKLIQKYLEPDSSNSLVVNIGSGVMYENEQFKVKNSEEEFNLVRLTNYLTLKWNIVEKFTFIIVSYYQPALKSFEDYRFTAEANLNFFIVKNLAFITEFKYRYDSQPVEGIKKFDLELLNGLTFFF